MLIPVCDEPEPLDAGALHRQADHVDSTENVECVSHEEGAAERARQHERSAAPHHHVRRDQPCPDRRLDKITKKVKTK